MQIDIRTTDQVAMDHFLKDFVRLCVSCREMGIQNIAKAIGIVVARKWIQYESTWKEHFDIAISR